MEYIIFAIGWICGAVSFRIYFSEKFNKASSESQSVRDNEKQNKDCSNCKHEQEMYQYPCTRCMNYEHWDAI